MEIMKRVEMLRTCGEAKAVRLYTLLPSSTFVSVVKPYNNKLSPRAHPMALASSPAAHTAFLS